MSNTINHIKLKYPDNFTEGPVMCGVNSREVAWGYYFEYGDGTPRHRSLSWCEECALIADLVLLSQLDLEKAEPVRLSHIYRNTAALISHCGLGAVGNTILTSNAYEAMKDEKRWDWCPECVKDEALK